MNRTGRPTGRPRGGTNHDPKIREKLLKLFQQGLGQTRVAHITGMSHGYVGNWWTIYLAHGKEALLEPMKQHKYSYETRLAAAKAVVDDKKDVVSVMRAYSIEGEENFVGDSEIIALGGASNETKDRPLG